jgi:hypothetical protein
MLESSIPEELRGIALTPGTVANWCGPETLAAYEEVLRRQNYELLVDKDGDVFWTLNNDPKIVRNAGIGSWRQLL